jgi:hypothetical protein
MKYPKFDGSQSCAETSFEFFYGENSDTASSVVAKKICRMCAFIVPCAEYAIEHEQFGVWGGLGPSERRALRRRNRIRLSKRTDELYGAARAS